MYDVDRDGCADLVMSRSQGEVGTDAPLVNHNKSSGQFEAMPPERSPDRTAISGSLCRTRERERRRGDRLSRCSGVTTALTVGPRTVDDFGTRVTLANTTPAGPVRCR